MKVKNTRTDLRIAGYVDAPTFAVTAPSRGDRPRFSPDESHAGVSDTSNAPHVPSVVLFPALS
jgi:hypothetical protein